MRRTVIKLGGSVLIDPALRRKLITQIVELASLNHGELIVVHGGGKQIASLLDRLGIESRFHDGLRVTDEDARDAAQMVLSGQVGKDLVAQFARHGVASVSIAGGDGMSFLAEKMNAEDGTDLGFVGRIIETRPGLINALLEGQMIPVIACLALGKHDYEYYNINGDQMAAAVAGGCSADRLVFVTDVGAVRDANGHNIASLNREQILQLLDTGVAGGGMRPKLRACLEALQSGVNKIMIIGAAEEGSLLQAVRDDLRIGTSIS